MSEQLGRVTGILGNPWRATVTPWGDVLPWDGSEPLTWAIAAEDRWHFPDRESSVRQTLVSGVPVWETRVRVPNGDLVQHVWSASSGTGTSALLVEFTNDSPLPVAIALGRADVVTQRSVHRLDEGERPWPSEDRGIDRPPVVVPLGHRTRTRIAIGQNASVAQNEIDSFPDWESVARGWMSIVDRASVVDSAETIDGVPLHEVVRRYRSSTALVPPVRGDRSTAETWLVSHRELVRMGLTDPDVPELVSALEQVLRSVRRDRRIDAGRADALRSGALVLGRFDKRALRDLDRAVQRTLRRCGHIERGDLASSLAACPRVSRASIDDWSDPAFDVVGIFESEIATWTSLDEVTLMPDGFGSGRLGVDFEAHRLPAGPNRFVSLAVRWHGERPAVIWEVDGPEGLLLRSGADPQWSTVESSGEALWSVPSGRPVAL